MRLYQSITYLRMISFAFFAFFYIRLFSSKIHAVPDGPYCFANAGIFLHFCNSFKKSFGEVLTVIRQELVGPLQLFFFKKPVYNFFNAGGGKIKSK